ncbi:MAG TPA: hypothetical protein VIL25_09885 [Vicinamibacterales bacterium]
MADIDVVQKRSSARIWFWVVLAIAALLILFLLMMAGGDRTVTEPQRAPISHLPEAAPSVAAWQT